MIDTVSHKLICANLQIWVQCSHNFYAALYTQVTILYIHELVFVLADKSINIFIIKEPMQARLLQQKWNQHKEI